VRGFGELAESLEMLLGGHVPEYRQDKLQHRCMNTCAGDDVTPWSKPTGLSGLELGCSAQLMSR